jgi:hypothetical protein
MDHDLPGYQPARGVIPRRTAIASVGALAAGVGAIGIGAYGKDAKPTADQQYNVRAFGAVGDGVADDTGHLQRALDAARSTGGIVFFPPGGTRTSGTCGPSPL